MTKTDRQDAAKNAFEGNEDLHDNTDQINQLGKTYQCLKQEYLDSKKKNANLPEVPLNQSKELHSVETGLQEILQTVKRMREGVNVETISLWP